MPQDVARPRFECVGGSSCLDFINTVSRVAFHDGRLNTCHDVIRWAAGARLLRPTDRRRLTRLAARNRRSAQRELRALLRLRSLLHRLFVHLGEGKRLRPDDLSSFNMVLRAVLRRAKLLARKGELTWSPEADADDLQGIRRLIVWDAARLLTSDRLGLVRRCANPTCGLVFLDESRRRNRRWCSMSDCGARAKAKRYYDRHRLSGRSVGKRRPRRR